MRNLLVTISILLGAQTALSGIPNSNSPLHCGESFREVIQEKNLMITSSKDAADLPIELRVQLIRYLVSCAGPNNVGLAKSALSVEVTARDINLGERMTRNILSPLLSSKFVVDLNLEAELLNERPLYTTTYKGLTGPVEASQQIQASIFEIIASNQFYSTYSKKIFSIEANLDNNMNHISNYFKNLTIQIEGLPKIGFEK
jgi:hypothetical protein